MATMTKQLDPVAELETAEAELDLLRKRIGSRDARVAPHDLERAESAVRFARIRLEAAAEFEAEQREQERRDRIAEIRASLPRWASQTEFQPPDYSGCHRRVSPARPPHRAGRPIARTASTPSGRVTMSDTTQTPKLNADGTIVRDATDVGVPMRPAPAGTTRQGPEDALDPNPTRGDYRDRLGPTHHTTTEARYSSRYDPQPQIVRVDQNEHAANIVDTGGPLDAADPDYEAKKATREGRQS